jgi:transposase
MIDFLTEAIDRLDGELKAIANAQKGCLALQAANYGVGPLIATAMLAELGDVSRLSSSRKAVRLAGIDVTVSESDGKQRGRRHLSRQGPPLLRWALYEAGGNAWRRASPDHDYYLQAKERLGSKRAKLATGRRVLRRSFHVLAGLGPDAVAPV